MPLAARAWLASVALLTTVLPAHALTAGQLCEKKAAAAARSCTKSTTALELKCRQQTGNACAPTDSRVLQALSKLESKVLKACPDVATVVAAGYGAVLTPAGLVDRLQQACAAAPASLAARSFGGPHGAVRSAAGETDRKCLDEAFKRGRSMLDYAFATHGKCVLAAHAGRTCDPAAADAKIAQREASTATAITARCADLAALVAVDPATFVARASAQARCLVAEAHGPTAPLTLDCGPRAAAPVPPLATNTQVVLDQSTSGSRCGDGSDYAFWVRLAPPGQPVGRVVIHLQGGGGCYSGPDCAGTDPDLFEAQSDAMPQNGIMSSTASTNPFRDWTKVFLPYCTQDLHIGGGITNAFPEITVHRYGAHNVRAALAWVRDVLWTSMNATDADGYRPDRLAVVFAGSSAGGYGAMYNYHWVLDDLGWPHTTVVPDAALGMDNGAVGVIALGTVALLPTTPGWNVRAYMPPYCQTASCAEIMNTLELAHAPRLLGAPEQQILNLSNQVDNVQRNTTMFPSTQAFVNTLRGRYCASQGTPGIRSFLRASSATVHGQLNNNAFDTVVIGGTLLRAWLGGAMAAPGAVIDKIATGTIEADFPGVAPFPCTVGSPSGAFLDG